MRRCHACGEEWAEAHQPGREEACLKCAADMHCCRNCEFYDTSRGDDCVLRNTDPPVDKQRWNDCYEFRLADRPDPGSGPSPDRNEDLKKKWDSLFKD